MLALLVLAACRGGGTGDPLLARTEQGLLRGAEAADGVAAFRGVPYARPPVGDLRWRPPEPPASWEGERDATAFAPACPQAAGTTGYYQRAAWRLGRDSTAVPALGPTSEDCLYLNVWTPAERDGPLPVFVWVHGGAGVSGSGSDPLFRGHELAARGLMVVAVGYRFGPLGFLAHPALSAEDPRGVSGNYALRDVIRALTWVRANATAFGGDPTRVTLAGQSSGGTAIEVLMTVPAARGLFHRVVSQSATLASPPPLRGGEGSAEARGARFLEAAGVPADAGADALRSVPVETLLAAAARLPGLAPNLPTVDGSLLPERPAEAWSRGAAAPLPILKGSNDDEFALFMPPTPLPPADYRAWVQATYDTLAGAVLEARPPGPDAESSRRQRVRVLSDEAFRVPELLTVRWSDGRAPVWLYRFSWRPDDGAVGAFHSAELPFVFGTHEAAGWWDGSPEVERLTSTIQQAWTRFAAYGDPVGGDVAGDGPLPDWPAATVDSPRVMVLDPDPRLAPMPAVELVRALNP